MDDVDTVKVIRVAFGIGKMTAEEMVSVHGKGKVIIWRGGIGIFELILVAKLYC